MDEHGPFIDGWPIKNGWIFHGYVSHNFNQLKEPRWDEPFCSGCGPTPALLWEHYEAACRTELITRDTSNSYLLNGTKGWYLTRRYLHVMFLQLHRISYLPVFG